MFTSADGGRGKQINDQIKGLLPAAAADNRSVIGRIKPENCENDGA